MIHTSRNHNSTNRPAMKLRLILPLGLAILVGITPAFAVVSMSWTYIDYINKLVDPATGRGFVKHAYNIGTYEVTNDQYVEFLNAKGDSNSYGICNSKMASYGIAQTGSSGNYTYNVTSGLGNRPVVFVSWYDAARFTNWLGNGHEMQRFFGPLCLRVVSFK